MAYWQDFFKVGHKKNFDPIADLPPPTLYPGSTFCHTLDVSFNVLVVGLIMEYLYSSCNQVLRIIKILAGYCEKLESCFKSIPLFHGLTTVLVVGHFSQLGY